MSTKLFKVITNDNLRVRTTPAVDRTNIIRNRFLVRDDILEVRADSSVTADGWLWWEHASSPGFWTASANANGNKILMKEHQPEHIVEPDPTPNADDTNTDDTTQVFEIQTTLNARSQPNFGNNIISGAQLQAGIRLEFKNPTQAHGYQWWEQAEKPGHWSASGSLAGGATLMRPVENISTDETYRMTVPWITQIQSGHNLSNDCGHTCVLMVMRYLGAGWDTSVADLYNLKQFRHVKGWTTSSNLVDMVNHVGQNFTRYSERTATLASMQTLKTILREKGPVISLVWYPSLGFSNPSNGNFNHWVVITGFSDNTFYINDPLWTTENRGGNRPVPLNRLLGAFQATNSTNKFVGVHPA